MHNKKENSQAMIIKKDRQNSAGPLYLVGNRRVNKIIIPGHGYQLHIQMPETRVRSQRSNCFLAIKKVRNYKKLKFLRSQVNIRYMTQRQTSSNLIAFRFLHQHLLDQIIQK